MKTSLSMTAAIAVVLCLPCAVLGGGAGKAADEVAEYVLKKFGRQAVKEGEAALAERIATAAARHGGDVLSAVRRVGPRALTLAEEAGADAPKALRLLARHGDEAATWVLKRPSGMRLLGQLGDDAATVMIKHKGVAEPVLKQVGSPAVKALEAVGGQGGRRLAMMTEGGELAALGHTPEVMDVISRYGDPAMDFIWRNKGPLAVGTALTAFLANPKPFIDGTAHLADSAATSVVKPIVEETGRAVSWLLWTLLVFAIVIPAGAFYLAVKHPKEVGGIAKHVLSVLRH